MPLRQVIGSYDLCVVIGYAAATKTTSLVKCLPVYDTHLRKADELLKEYPLCGSDSVTTTGMFVREVSRISE